MGSGLRTFRLALFLLLISMVALLTGCANKRGGPVPYEVTGFGAPDAPTAVSVGED